MLIIPILITFLLTVSVTTPIGPALFNYLLDVQTLPAAVVYGLHIAGTSTLASLGWSAPSALSAVVAVTPTPLAATPPQAAPAVAPPSLLVAMLVLALLAGFRWSMSPKIQITPVDDDSDEEETWEEYSVRVLSSESASVEPSHLSQPDKVIDATEDAAAAGEDTVPENLAGADAPPQPPTPADENADRPAAIPAIPAAAAEPIAPLQVVHDDAQDATLEELAGPIAQPAADNNAGAAEIASPLRDTLHEPIAPEAVDHDAQGADHEEPAQPDAGATEVDDILQAADAHHAALFVDPAAPGPVDDIHNMAQPLPEDQRVPDWATLALQERARAARVPDWGALARQERRARAARVPEEPAAPVAQPAADDNAGAAEIDAPLHEIPQEPVEPIAQPQAVDNEAADAVGVDGVLADVPAVPPSADPTGDADDDADDEFHYPGLAETQVDIDAGAERVAGGGVHEDHAAESDIELPPLPPADADEDAWFQLDGNADEDAPALEIIATEAQANVLHVPLPADVPAEPEPAADQVDNRFPWLDVAIHHIEPAAFEHFFDERPQPPPADEEVALQEDHEPEPRILHFFDELRPPSPDGDEAQQAPKINAPAQSLGGPWYDPDSFAGRLGEQNPLHLRMHLRKKFKVERQPKLEFLRCIHPGNAAIDIMPLYNWELQRALHAISMLDGAAYPAPDCRKRAEDLLHCATFDAHEAPFVPPWWVSVPTAPVPQDPSGFFIVVDVKESVIRFLSGLLSDCDHTDTDHPAPCLQQELRSRIATIRRCPTGFYRTLRQKTYEERAIQGTVGDRAASAIQQIEAQEYAQYPPEWNANVEQGAYQHTLQTPDYAPPHPAYQMPFYGVDSGAQVPPGALAVPQEYGHPYLPFFAPIQHAWAPEYYPAQAPQQVPPHFLDGSAPREVVQDPAPMGTTYYIHPPAPWFPQQASVPPGYRQTGFYPVTQSQDYAQQVHGPGQGYPMPAAPGQSEIYSTDQAQGDFPPYPPAQSQGYPQQQDSAPQQPTIGPC